MKTRQEAITFAQTLGNTYLDTPFHDPNWVLVRIRENKKAFLWTYEKDGIMQLNVKVDPSWRDLWRKTYPSVIAGWHQNKEHWNTILLDGTIPDEEIKRMIAESYDLLSDSPTKRIYEAVKRIPKGQVATYGQVAILAGNPKMSRAVGNALHKNPDPEHIPCYRVVNSKGLLAGAFAFGGEHAQEELLKADGIEVVNGKVDLLKFGMKIENMIDPADENDENAEYENAEDENAEDGSGCDHEDYMAAGYEKLLVYRKEKADGLGKKRYPDLQNYIDRNYIAEKSEEGYGELPKSLRKTFSIPKPKKRAKKAFDEEMFSMEECCKFSAPLEAPDAVPLEEFSSAPSFKSPLPALSEDEEALKKLKQKLDERKAHLADSFSEYLLYLIHLHGRTNVEVYKNALVDKKLFAKIKNDPGYHPQKLTCLQLCMGAELNLDETKDLLARAGYALSPCDMRDVIFSYFIENEIFDIIELDIQLEEYGLPCIIA